MIPTLANGLLAAASRRDTPAVAAIGRVLWAATSARGRKAALRFFPNSVDAFEPVARLLAGAAGVGVGGGSGAEDCPWAAVGADLGREGDAASPSNLDDRPVGGGGGRGAPVSSPASLLETWPARCCLLLWLAQAATIPFPMALLDPTGGSGGRRSAAHQQPARARAAPAGDEVEAPEDDGGGASSPPPASSSRPLHHHPDWTSSHASPCPLAYDRLTAGAVAALAAGDDDPPSTSAWPALARAAEAACRASLSSPGADREAAVLALGRLLARPDADAPDSGRRLTRFVGWAAAIAAAGGGSGAGGETEPTAAAAADVRSLGAAAALAQVFARAERRALVPVAPAAWRAAEALLAGGGCGAVPPRTDHRGGHAAPVPAARRPPGVQVRRAAVKLAARVALASLPAAGSVGGGAAAGLLPGRVEAAAAALVAALRDRDTAVRWAAAKGLARVGAALASATASHCYAGAVAAIADACLSLCDPAEPDAAWHGGCLALASLLLARRGGGAAPALPPGRLPRLVAAAAAALAYDVRRGGSGVGVGAHVRDAGAYVAWALARAGLAREDLAALAAPLGAPLAAAAAFDREVNCRRAAAAAFQELAGRCGPAAPAFAHAPLDAAAALDFYALASARSAALTVGTALSGLGGPYPAALTSHLVSSKAGHWCRSTRNLAAEALVGVCVAGVGAGCGSPAPDAAEALSRRLLAPGAGPEARAGAAAALAALVAGGAPATAPSPATIDGLVHALPARFPALVKGRGGEAVREGVLALVAALAAGAPPGGSDDPGPPAARPVVAFIEANLRHPAAVVREAAAGALAALSGRPAPPPAAGWAPPPPDTARTFMSWLSPTAPVEARRGGAAGLGALAAAYLAPCADAVVSSLASAIRLEADPAARDAEARAGAAAALGGLVPRLLLAPALPRPSHRSALRSAALAALLGGAADYATDRRGDVGSWVRCPSAAGATGLVLAAAAVGEGGADEAAALAARLLPALVRLACERLAKLRVEARAHLQALVDAADGRGGGGGFLGPAGPPLAAALASSRASKTSAPQEDLSLATALLGQPSLPPSLASAALTGLVACIGGLDAPLSRAAGRALVAGGLSTSTPALLVDTFTAAWSATAADPRLATPWLRAADALLAGLAPEEAEAALSGCGGGGSGGGGATATQRGAALLASTLAACRGCRDPPRLGAAAAVLCHLAGLARPEVASVARGALAGATALLGHPSYPTVRRAAAEALCVRLVLGVPAAAVAAADLDAAADLVAGTAWDGPLDDARAGRRGVCEALGVEVPKAEAAASKENEGAAAAGAPVPAKPAGYQALVDAMERGTA